MILGSKKDLKYHRHKPLSYLISRTVDLPELVAIGTENGYPWFRCRSGKMLEAVSAIRILYVLSSELVTKPDRGARLQGSLEKILQNPNFE